MYIVSGCLAGMKCRYHGKDSKKEDIVRLVKEGKAIPICPEVLGNLPTPRCPCEQIKEAEETRVVGNDGEDYTNAFIEGAIMTASIAKTLRIKKAILQERSPSCGVHSIYDGTFEGTIIEGKGITTKLLEEDGVITMSYEEYQEKDNDNT